MLGIIITSYVLFAIGLQTMAKREDTPNDWFAWIPILNWYLIAEMVKENQLIKSGGRFLLITLPTLVLYIITAILAEALALQSAGVSGLFNILSFIFLIGTIIYIWVLHYYLLARYTTSATILIILSMFISDIILSIAIYALRNKPVRVETTPPTDLQNTEQTTINLEK